MKKFFIVLGFCVLGLNFAPTAEAAHFSVSIGGMPGVMVVDNCGYVGYSGYGMPYYSSGFYYHGHGHRYHGHHHPPKPHHPPMHGGGRPSSHHGPHGYR